MINKTSLNYEEMTREVEPIFSGLNKFSKNDEQITFINYSHNYCVCIVDIVDSTRNTSEIKDSNKIKQYYSVFLNTMSSIIKNHQGRVIKNSGDCLLYYFPKTVNPCDELAFQDVIECGLAMIEANERLNSILQENGLSCINYRISGNYGMVELAMSVNSYNVDLFGAPVNICSKINHLASSNQMIIHDNLFQVIKKMPCYKDYVFKKIDNSTTTVLDRFDEENSNDNHNHNHKHNNNNNHNNNHNNKSYGSTIDNNGNSDKRYSLMAYIVHRPQEKIKQIESEVKKQQRYNEILHKKQNQTNSSFNILLIDDDEDILFAFTSVIECQGYKVTSFSNPYLALDHFSKINPYHYDLIVMDIRMPGLNGIKLYSKIKMMNPDVKIIFLSALNALDEILSIFPEIRNTDIFRKPIEPITLINKITLELRN